MTTEQKTKWFIDTKWIFRIALANVIVWYLGLDWYFYVLVNGSLIGLTWERTKTEKRAWWH